ncbi:MAG: hypothetical protein JWR70_1002 [Modestobacter sp.]|nr:hypothetical protein [Modestobacter sp.]
MVAQPVERLLAGYRPRARPAATPSENAVRRIGLPVSVVKMKSCRVIAAVPVWISASKRPSARAPIATRCSVAVRPPTIR